MINIYEHLTPQQVQMITGNELIYNVTNLGSGIYQYGLVNTMEEHYKVTVEIKPIVCGHTGTKIVARLRVLKMVEVKK